jgi:hypothetical protein
MDIWPNVILGYQGHYKCQKRRLVALEMEISALVSGWYTRGIEK